MRKTKALQILSVCLFLLFAGCASVRVEAPSFAQSKKQLQNAYKQYNFHTEFYYGVDFDPDTLKLVESNAYPIDNTPVEAFLNHLPKESPSTQAVQGYTPRKAFTSKGKVNIQAKRIEFEHIMPAHRFGGNLICWQKGGRKAYQNDKEFRKWRQRKET